MSNNTTLKFLKQKQKAHLKEHKEYATDDITISQWMDEYHENCVMDNALNNAVLGSANDEFTLRKLWMDIVNKRMEIADIKTTSFEVSGFADSVVMSYRGTFIDYVQPLPPEPYIPYNPPANPPEVTRGVDVDGEYDWGLSSDDVTN